jgi:hypothetical protein
MQKPISRRTLVNYALDPDEANSSQTLDAGIVEYCPLVRGRFQTQAPQLVVRTQLQAIDTLNK